MKGFPDSAYDPLPVARYHVAREHPSAIHGSPNPGRPPPLLLAPPLVLISYLTAGSPARAGIDLTTAAFINDLVRQHFHQF